MNAICITVFGRAASHVSGLTTLTGVALAHQELRLLWVYGLQLFCFFLGALVASLLVGGHRKFRGGPKYSLVLLVIGSTVLSAAAVGWANGWPESVGSSSSGALALSPQVVCWLVAFACGAQNGMTTFVSGAIVRTTHVTGTLTDLGIEAAGLLLRRGNGTWKLEVLCCFLLSFALGGCGGGLAAAHFPTTALAYPGSLYFALAALNYAW